MSDGQDVWLARIESVGRDRVEFALVENCRRSKPQLHTTLLLSVVKFDAFEWAIEKATELGVSRIVPLAAARSEKALLAAAAKRAERWKKILMEASQQSRRVRVPSSMIWPSRKPPSLSPLMATRVMLSERPTHRRFGQFLNGKQSRRGCPGHRARRRLDRSRIRRRPRRWLSTKPRSAD